LNLPNSFLTGCLLCSICKSTVIDRSLKEPHNDWALFIKIYRPVLRRL
jgi:hypothetical protein